MSCINQTRVFLTSGLHCCNINENAKPKASIGSYFSSSPTSQHKLMRLHQPGALEQAKTNVMFCPNCQSPLRKQCKSPVEPFILYLWPPWHAILVNCMNENRVHWQQSSFWTYGPSHGYRNDTLDFSLAFQSNKQQQQISHQHRGRRKDTEEWETVAYI